MRAYVSIIFFIYFTTNTLGIGINVENSTPISDESNNITKLHIAIYYESLCSDSTDFLTNQFAPVYDSFKDYMDVLFVPFGKSESEKNEKNGFDFFCQHGPAECTGNSLQSCVLDILIDDQDAKVKFVTCQMSSNAEYTGQKCANSVNASFADVSKCSSGPKGIELQLEAEKETHLIRKPYPSYIPTIVYNKQFNAQKQWRSLREFKKLICEELQLMFRTNNELLKACV